MCHKNLAPLSRRRSLTCHSSICFIAQDSLAQNYTSVKLGLAVNLPLPSTSLILGKVMNQEFGTFHPDCGGKSKKKLAFSWRPNSRESVELVGSRWATFSPLFLVWASSLLRQLSEGELPNELWRGGGIFSCRVSQSRHSPSFLPFASFHASSSRGSC